VRAASTRFEAPRLEIASEAPTVVTLAQKVKKLARCVNTSGATLP
jgi:hypothetical protein